jgi:hypothetical protein
MRVNQGAATYKTGEGRAGDIRDLLPKVAEVSKLLQAAKSRLAPAPFWYPYQSMSNVEHLDGLLTGPNRDLLSLIGKDPIADIGAADGDMAFLFESLGLEVDVLDYAPTNFNGLKGVRLLKEALNARLSIHEVDLDSQFVLPRKRYGLAVFLGLLYHLQNPFYALKTLARSARHALISTRIARGTADRSLEFDRIPVAYLLDPAECNNDATNYWIFSDAGLRRLLDRTGWDVLDYRRVGATRWSDPSTPQGDERAFLLARSRVTT